MPRPICIPCQRFFRVKRNGVNVLEGKPNCNDAPPGKTHPQRWQPYKVWRADTYVCRGCGAEIAAGFGMGPIWSDFPESEMPPVDLRVNDC